MKVSQCMKTFKRQLEQVNEKITRTAWNNIWLGMENKKIHLIQGLWTSNSVESNDNDKTFIHVRTFSVSKGLLCLVSYVEERPWWPYKAPTMEERRERLRGEGDQITFVDLGFERWQVARFRKGSRGKTFHNRDYKRCRCTLVYWGDPTREPIMPERAKNVRHRGRFPSIK